MFTLILAEWQARAVESLITYNYTCTWTLISITLILICKLTIFYFCRLSSRLATIPGIGIARNRFFCQFLGMWVRNRFLFKGVTCSDSFFHTLKDIYIQSIIAILINFDAQLGKILINFPWVPTWKRNHDRSHDSDSLGAKESELDLESHFEESLQA